uniref:Uncharacterized protein n=1 Tax=Compsopogon caeruleus TaxID=31354 RepID=A0A7S1XCV6_9RHOD|mmetsp:Transcript_13596/g.27854  ORF Transcript_13596/g.27854 Transcript_13596/m.27854 type:complete len:288 (+) Transcript_13596:100-963(+)
MAVWLTMLMTTLFFREARITSAGGLGRWLTRFREKEMASWSRDAAQLVQGDSRRACGATALRFVLGSAEQSCFELREAQLSSFALETSSCLLERSGRPFLRCVYTADDSEQRLCLSRMSSEQFAIYAGFYTHGPALCHFLQGQDFRDEMLKSASRLSSDLSSIHSDLIKSHHSLKSIVANSTDELHILRSEIEKVSEDTQLEVHAIRSYYRSVVLFYILFSLPNGWSFLTSLVTWTFAGEASLALGFPVFDASWLALLSASIRLLVRFLQIVFTIRVPRLQVSHRLH